MPVASGDPRLVQRLWYACVISWPLVAPVTFVVFVMASYSVATQEWDPIAISVGLYVPLIVLALSLDLRVESSVRRAVRRMGWEYALWGSSASTYRIAAPPFSEARALRTAAWGRGVFRGRPYESFFVANDAARFTGQSYVLAFRLEREYPTVRLARAGGMQRQLEGRAAVSTEAFEFGRRWRVMADDPEFAHAFFSPQVIRRLLDERNPPPNLTISGNYAFVHGQPGHVLAPGRLALLADIVASVPTGVVAKFSRGQAGTASPSGTALGGVLEGHPTHTGMVFVRPASRTWVARVAFVVMLAIPLLGPFVAAALLGREGRRGTGSDGMYRLAVAIGVTEGMIGWLLASMF